MILIYRIDSITFLSQIEAESILRRIDSQILSALLMTRLLSVTRLFGWETPQIFVSKSEVVGEIMLFYFNFNLDWLTNQNDYFYLWLKRKSRARNRCWEMKHKKLQFGWKEKLTGGFMCFDCVLPYYSVSGSGITILWCSTLDTENIPPPANRMFPMFHREIMFHSEFLNKFSAAT